MGFSGIIAALVTPFSKGQLDKASFLKLLRFQTEGGIRQFVLASTTGESPVLEKGELERLCSWLREFERDSRLSLKLILPTGSYSTKTAVEKTKKAEGLGAEGVLAVTPYYNKPPQRGLIAHFEKMAGASALPLILYNVPSRTACSLTVETIKILAQIDNIVGIKEATGDMEFLKAIKNNVPEDFSLLSGDDPSAAEFFNLGGHGAISAGANVLPKEMISLLNSPAEKRLKLSEKRKAFWRELFKETNPVGAKQALHEMGIIKSPELRLPLMAIKNPKLARALASLSA